MWSSRKKIKQKNHIGKKLYLFWHGESIISIALIRWISLQAKTTFFVGQNLDAKNYTYCDMERVSYMDPIQ